TNKAYTAASFKQSTQELSGVVGQAWFQSLIVSSNGRVTAGGGAIPLEDGGALAVAGGTDEQDHRCPEPAIRRFGSATMQLRACRSGWWPRGRRIVDDRRDVASTSDLYEAHTEPYTRYTTRQRLDGIGSQSRLRSRRRADAPEGRLEWYRRSSG